MDYFQNSYEPGIEAALANYVPYPSYVPLNFQFIPGGRIRVTYRCGDKLKSFRSPTEAKVEVRNLYNPGNCIIDVVAVGEEDGEFPELASVKLLPGERLSVFSPPPQTKYLFVIHHNGNGCPAAIATLECDDIPRV